MTEINPDIEQPTTEVVKTEASNNEKGSGQRVLDEDFFYPDNQVEGRQKDDAVVSAKHARFQHNFGMNTYKIKNLHSLHSSFVISANGNQFQLLNISNMKLKFQEGKDGDGIGCLCVSPTDKNFFAVGEKGDKPNIYVYKMIENEPKVQRILAGGAERGYNSIDFSFKSNQLASVASYPDYSLTVWDWKKERIVLKVKANSLDVYNVQFSPTSEGHLVTGGAGHIKFWKMAKTFTGLKLQGDLGKFGKFELSDIQGFQEMQNGKVITGSEQGDLLLWEGNLVKARLVQSEGDSFVACHQGKVDNVLFHEGVTQVVSAGFDGWIKQWSQQEIDDLEPDETQICRIQLQNSFHVDAEIVDLAKGQECWLVQDAHGKLIKVSFEGTEQNIIQTQNSGPIVDMFCLEKSNGIVAMDQEGNIRVYDLKHKKDIICQPARIGKGTVLAYPSENYKNACRVFTAGFDNGILRTQALTEDRLILVHAVKVFDALIEQIRFSTDYKAMVVANSKEMFFFKVVDFNQQQPYCFIKFADFDLKCFDLSEGGAEQLLLGCSDGMVRKISNPIQKPFDNSKSFEWENQLAEDKEFIEWKVKQLAHQIGKITRRIKKENNFFEEQEEFEEDEPEWKTQPISAILIAKDNEGFYTSAGGQFAGSLYYCKFTNNRPLKLVKNTSEKVILLRQSMDGRQILQGTSEGKMVIRMVGQENNQMELPINGNSGHTSSVYMNQMDNLAVASNTDGILTVMQLDKDILDCKAKEVKELPDPCRFRNQESEIQLEPFDVDLPSKQVRDIDNPQVYSIQNDKLKSEQDKLEADAELYKENIRLVVRGLREQQANIIHENDSKEWYHKLDASILNVDSDLLDILKTKSEEKVEYSKKQLRWWQEKHALELRKVKDHQINSCETDYFAIESFKDPQGIRAYSIRTEHLEHKDVRQRATVDIKGRTSLMEGKSEQLNSYQRMFKTKLANLKNATRAISKDPQAEFKIFQQRRDKLTKALQLIEDDRKNPETSAAKRKQEKYKVQLKLQNLADEEFKQHKNTQQQDTELANSEDVVNTLKKLGKQRLKDLPDNPNQDLNHKLTAQKRRSDYKYTTDQILQIKRNYNTQMFEMKKRKLAILQQICSTKQKVHDINVKLKQEDEDDIFGQVEFLTNDEEITNKYNISDEEALFYDKYDKWVKEQEKNKENRGGLIGKKVVEEKLEFYASNKNKPMQLEKIKFKTKTAPNNERARKIFNTRERSLEIEKRLLITRLKETISKFDSDLENLIQERMQDMEVVKILEMKQIAIYEDTNYLNEVIMEDKANNEKVIKYTGEIDNFADQLHKIQTDIRKTEAELNHINDHQMKNLDKEFESLLEQESKDELREFYSKFQNREFQKRGSMIHADDQMNDDNQTQLEEEVMMEINNSKDKDKLTTLWRQKCELKRDYQAKFTQNKGYIQSKANINEKLQTTLADCNTLNDLIDSFERAKWKRIYEKTMFLVLNVRQFEVLEDKKEKREGSSREVAFKQIVHSLTNEHDHSMSAIVINKDQIKQLKDRIEHLKREAEKKDQSKNIEEAKNRSIFDQRKAKEQKEKFNEMMVLKLSTNLPLSSISTLFEESNFQDIGKLEREIHSKEQEVAKEITAKEAEIERLKRHKAEMVGTITNLLKKLNLKKDEQQNLITKIDKEKETSLNQKDEDAERREEEQIQELKELLSMQAREIDTLYTEINLFKRKGGHIYTTVTANKRNLEN